MLGVSLIICCYNSANKLPQTIKRVHEITVPEDIPWEVIIVDNASTDATCLIARALTVDAKFECRIVTEQKLGLKYARIRGAAESKYDFLSFIDDDNWVCAEWIQNVYAVMSTKPDVGACGGMGVAAFETDPPFWFDQYKDCFAIGEQCETTGYVPPSRGYLWGAGLTIRRSAWEQLYNRGFRFALTGRQGNKLSSGEDSELCFALRLTGWELYYESRLRFEHFMPSSRLKWPVLRGLMRAYGVSIVFHDIYKKKLNRHEIKFGLGYLCKEICTVLRNILHENLYKEFANDSEGKWEVLRAEMLIGTLQELFRLIFSLNASKNHINAINNMADNSDAPINSRQGTKQ